MLKNFAELIAKQETQSLKRVAVINPTDEASLKGIFDERLVGRVKAVLIGEQLAIEKQLKDLKLPLDGAEIIDTPASEAAAKGVALAKDGTVDVLMKGHIQTRDFLKPVIAKETGIAVDSLLTHVVLTQVPAYDRLFITTDGGMVPEPNFEQKVKIIKNGMSVLNKLGYTKPKVAVLAASETVNPSIHSSVEAKELQEYFTARGEEFPCEIDGPLSFDLAVSREIAAMKGYDSPVAGQADILIGPDMTAMNLVGKSITVFGKGQMAGIICGAKIPIVMTSRGSSSEEKYLSIVLASLVSD